MPATKVYEVTSGRIHRHEGGKLVKYKVGSKVQLTDEDAVKFAGIVKPVATPVAAVSPTHVFRGGEDSKH